MKIDPEKIYLDKINSFIFMFEKNKRNLNILEFGVREGRSTKMFLDMFKISKGKLISVDVDDYSHLFNNENWTFLNTRDDNYDLINKYINDQLDIILIDSLHEPNHVEKLIYLYWKHLKLNGSIYIDDTSWVPYSKNNWRDHKYTETINRDTFFKVLDIFNTNTDKISLNFSFDGSGMCRIVKKKNTSLNISKKIDERKINLKMKFKELLKILK